MRTGIDCTYNIILHMLKSVQFALSLIFLANFSIVDSYENFRQILLNHSVLNFKAVWNFSMRHSVRYRCNFRFVWRSYTARFEHVVKYQLQLSRQLNETAPMVFSSRKTEWHVQFDLIMKNSRRLAFWAQIISIKLKWTWFTLSILSYYDLFTFNYTYDDLIGLVRCESLKTWVFFSDFSCVNG